MAFGEYMTNPWTDGRMQKMDGMVKNILLEKSQFTCGLKTIKVYMKETLPGGWHGTEKSKRFGMFRAQTVVCCDGEECLAKMTENEIEMQKETRT